MAVSKTNSKAFSVSAKADLLRDIFSIFAATTFIALMAQVSIPLPFTVVPVTGQTFAVLLISALLTPKKAVLAILNYIFFGAMGLPVFSMATAGTAILIGPTAGYIFGFILSGLVVSYLIHSLKPQKTMTIALCMWVGSIFVFSCGSLWLGKFVGYDKAFAMGVLPFIPGDLLKIFLAATSYRLYTGFIK